MCIISLGNKQYHYYVYIYTCVCSLWFFYQSGNPFFLFLLCNLFCMPIVMFIFHVAPCGPKIGNKILLLLLLYKNKKC